MYFLLWLAKIFVPLQGHQQPLELGDYERRGCD